MPCGFLNPLANVVTTPAGVILRTALFVLSATYTLPSGSNATSFGAANFAAAPVPFVLPDVVWPASNDVVPWRPATRFVGAFGTKPGVTLAALESALPAMLLEAPT